MLLTAKRRDSIIMNVSVSETETLTQQLRDLVKVFKDNYTKNNYQAAFAEDAITEISKELIKRDFANAVKSIIKEVK